MKRTALLVLCFLMAIPGLIQAQPGTWAAGFGSTFSDDVKDIVTDASGNIYLTGSFQDTLRAGSQMLTSKGETDIFVISLDQAGAVRWMRSFGDTGFEFSHHLAIDNAGALYICGDFRDSTVISGDTIWGSGAFLGLSDILLIKTDLNGNYMKSAAMGDPGTEVPQGMAVSGDGKLYLTGFFRTHWTRMPGDTLFNRGLEDAFILKADTSLNQLWVQGIGGSYNDRGVSISVLGDTALYISGTFSDSCYFRDSTIFTVTAGWEDIFVIKMDTGGAYRWHWTGGSTAPDFLHEHVQSVSGDIYLTGSFDSTFTSGTNSITSAGFLDVFLGKLTATGTLSWLNGYGYNEYDAAYGVAINPVSNEILITGHFQDRIDFGTQTLTTQVATDQDVFIAAFDVNGSPVWAIKAGGASLDNGLTITAENSGYIYASGQFNATASFGDTSLVTNGAEDVFVLRMTSQGQVGIEEEITGTEGITMYPNPASQYFTVKSEKWQHANVSITDLNGRLVGEFKTGSKIDCSSWQQGIYFVKWTAGDETGVGKLVVNR